MRGRCYKCGDDQELGSFQPAHQGFVPHKHQIALHQSATLPAFGGHSIGVQPF